VEGYTSLTSAPVIGPKAADALRAFVAPTDAPAMPGKGDVEAMLGLLASVKRRRQNSEAEASAQLEQYWQGLRDVPLDDLRHAYDVLLKGSPWFPDISEVREAARGGPVAAYRRRCLAARSLIAKHEREWVAPVAVCSPEEAAQARRLLDDAVEGVKA